MRLEKPDFSEHSSLSDLHGQVVTQVQIDVDGKPMQVKILKSTNQLLDIPVTKAIMHSRFTPGEMSTGPVVSWLTIPIAIKQK